MTKSRATAKAIERALRAAGFVYVAGWVKAKDAPDIIEKIAAAKIDADRTRSDTLMIKKETGK